MLRHDDAMWEALQTHQEGRTYGIATYQGVSTTVRVDSGSLTFSGDAQIQASGSVVVSGHGNSLVPRNRTDPLAPTGQELALFREVTIRSQVWSIPLGVYRITRAGDSTERQRAGVVLDWSLSLSLSDRFKMLVDNDFLSVASPLPGNTVWAEMRRLAPMPVQEALVNVSVPAATVYDTRVGATTTLAELLGGAPHMTREGVLTARLRDAWLTSTVPLFDIDGTITWADELTDDFVNQVQVTSSRDASIVAFAQLSNPWDPLSVGRAGGRTFKQSSPIYETQASAQAAANTILARLSSRRSRQVKVSCTPEALLLELGDFGRFTDPVQNRSVLGEVAGSRISMDPTATIELTVIVAEED